MPLTIQYCSDLHLEFDLNKKWVNKYPLEVRADILLLGGDIVPFAQLPMHQDFFDFVSKNYKAVYWIPGNHEYYHSDIADRSGVVHEAIRDNVFLVNNTVVHVENLDIICTTLWSHISPANEWDIRCAMSDFHIIKSGRGPLSIGQYNALHADSLEFLKDGLYESSAPHKIILTHHVPTLMNYPPKYKGDVLNEAFASELYDLIEASGADYWIYGHTHYNTPDFKIGSTLLLSNQLGYVKHGEHGSFSNTKVLTIDA